jgi:hypothetical protein
MIVPILILSYLIMGFLTTYIYNIFVLNKTNTVDTDMVNIFIWPIRFIELIILLFTR